ncbi:SKIT3 protein, partial [Amia calva]|nr:SKIT3 protein [Amia calva]
LSPEMNATALEMRWFRDESSNPVYLYKDGKKSSGYEGIRVRLYHQDLGKGNVSLLLKEVHERDSGFYVCHVSIGIYYEETPLQLLVRIEPFSTMCCIFTFIWKNVFDRC